MGSEAGRDDSAHLIRHSRAKYDTYGKIKKSENPRAEVDSEDQLTPDLTEAGVNLAKEKAEAFFAELNPETDALFFVSSNEARALETANIYRQAAHAHGFEIIKPEHVRGELAEEIGEGEIRTLDRLSLNIKDTLMTSVFNPDNQLGSINWGAVDEDFKAKWAQARAIINSNDRGSYGANLFEHSEAIAKIFPELKTAKELYDTNFKQLVRLAEFGVNKAKESGMEKNIKILGFGHENYMTYAANKYFADHGIANCESLDINIDAAGSKTITKKGQTVELE